MSKDNSNKPNAQTPGEKAKAKQNLLEILHGTREPQKKSQPINELELPSMSDYGDGEGPTAKKHSVPAAAVPKANTTTNPSNPSNVVTTQQQYPRIANNPNKGKNPPPPPPTPRGGNGLPITTTAMMAAAPARKPVVTNRSASQKPDVDLPSMSSISGSTTRPQDEVKVPAPRDPRVQGGIPKPQNPFSVGANFARFQQNQQPNAGFNPDITSRFYDTKYGDPLNPNISIPKQEELDAIVYRSLGEEIKTSKMKPSRFATSAPVMPAQQKPSPAPVVETKEAPKKIAPQQIPTGLLDLLDKETLETFWKYFSFKAFEKNGSTKFVLEISKEQLEKATKTPGGMAKLAPLFYISNVLSEFDITIPPVSLEKLKQVTEESRHSLERTRKELESKKTIEQLKKLRKALIQNNQLTDEAIERFATIELDGKSTKHLNNNLFFNNYKLLKETLKKLLTIEIYPANNEQLDKAIKKIIKLENQTLIEPIKSYFFPKKLIEENNNGKKYKCLKDKINDEVSQELRKHYFTPQEDLATEILRNIEITRKEGIRTGDISAEVPRLLLNFLFSYDPTKEGYTRRLGKDSIRLGTESFRKNYPLTELLEGTEQNRSLVEYAQKNEGIIPALILFNNQNYSQALEKLSLYINKKIKAGAPFTKVEQQMIDLVTKDISNKILNKDPITETDINNAIFARFFMPSITTSERYGEYRFVKFGKEDGRIQYNNFTKENFDAFIIYTQHLYRRDISLTDLSKIETLDNKSVLEFILESSLTKYYTDTSFMLLCDRVSQIIGAGFSPQNDENNLWIRFLARAVDCCTSQNLKETNPRVQFPSTPRGETPYIFSVKGFFEAITNKIESTIAIEFSKATVDIKQAQQNIASVIKGVITSIQKSTSTDIQDFLTRYVVDKASNKTMVDYLKNICTDFGLTINFKDNLPTITVQDTSNSTLMKAKAKPFIEAYKKQRNKTMDSVVEAPLLLPSHNKTLKQTIIEQETAEAQRTAAKKARIEAQEKAKKEAQEKAKKEAEEKAKEEARKREEAEKQKKLDKKRKEEEPGVGEKLFNKYLSVEKRLFTTPEEQLAKENARKAKAEKTRQEAEENARKEAENARKEAEKAKEEAANKWQAKIQEEKANKEKEKDKKKENGSSGAFNAILDAVLKF